MQEKATPAKVHLVGKELSKGSSFLFTAWTALCGDGISGKGMITNRGRRGIDINGLLNSLAAFRGGFIMPENLGTADV